MEAGTFAKYQGIEWANVIPFVLESTGHLGKEAETLFLTGLPQTREPSAHGSSRNCRLFWLDHKARCAFKLTRSYASIYAVPREIVEIAFFRSFEILVERFVTLIGHQSL